jgi:hypothetical protein
MFIWEKCKKVLWHKEVQTKNTARVECKGARREGRGGSAVCTGASESGTGAKGGHDK